MWTLLATVLSATIALAQGACLSLEPALLDALAICDALEIDTICYGAGDITLDSSAEDIRFESSGDVADLSEIASL